MNHPLSSFLNKHLTPLRINRFWFIYYTVGIAGFTIPFTRSLFRDLIGFSILLSAVLMLFFHRPWNRRFVIASLVVVLGGFFIEVAGVSTGLVFGQYHYGNSMGPRLFETPLLIGLNWWMLIYMISQLTRQTNLNTFSQLTIGAAVMAGYDVFLEPVAIATGMWDWNSQDVPIQNYLAWFVISFFFLGLFRWIKPGYNNPVANKLLTAQLLFFVMLNIINQISGI